MANALFFATVIGVLLSFIYDVSLFLSHLFSKKGITFLLDFLWWIITAFLYFSFLIIFNNGAVRTVYLVFMAVGFFLWHYLVSNPLKPLRTKCTTIFRRLVRKCTNVLKKSYKTLKKVLQLPFKLLYNKLSSSVGAIKPARQKEKRVKPRHTKRRMPHKNKEVFDNEER